MNDLLPAENSAAPPPEAAVEQIAGYAVHPAASLFPLMDGDAFTELVDSIRKHGIRQPVVLHDGVVVDGRNRLRAVEQLRQDGVAVELSTVELSSLIPGTVTVVDWIYSTNKIRRHMTADALAVVAAKMLPLIEAEAAKQQAATRFTKGQSGNPAGRKKQAATKTSSPARRKRDRKKSDARSSVGRVASMAGTSMHKAKQAVAVTRGQQDGTVSPADVQAVCNGTKKLRDVAPKPSRGNAKCKSAPPSSLEDQVERAWEKFKDRNFAIADLPEVRRIVKRLINAEEKANG